MYIYRLIILCLFFLMSTDLYANSCAPAPNKIGKIDRVHFDNSFNYLSFVLVDYPYDWMLISPDYGIDKSYGKVMTAIVLTAYVTGSDVYVGYCEGDGHVNKVRISYKT
ncbi:hypothetical protein SAMN05216604_12330 [Pseudomonas agarici]|nr:hypothetical protein SAMN05216604_12330 [Pseudomonas agarici]